MERHPERNGYMLALAAFGLWGVIPIYFKALLPVDNFDVVAHRVLYAVPTLAVMIAARHRWGEVRAALADRRVMTTLLGTAILISINWTVYIVGVNDGHVLATSLGYYLNPLLNVMIGRFLLGEHLGRLQWSALAIAALGVAALAAGALADLWITLTLAASFAFYGYWRKKVAVGAVAGLFLETLMLMPLTILWLGWLRDMGDPLFGPTPWHGFLLVISGAVTAIPLLMFTAGARRLPYSTVGILQFIAPTIQFFLAVFLFGEAFTPVRMFAFAAIWTAMALYIAGLVRNAHAKRLSLAKQ
ncbi:EamA family transporter RarD [Sphingomicrobium nitratireducens]|uniref:EamA family transporter RarD n=1 Tax=Sphingomicrobium nitratireducens TaxID=2964666 RepID=UPI00223F57B7|nr:EamA family transporter RarD [Sphingomicrobium nitratireducens]